MVGTHLISFILSQFFGLYLLIVSVIMFTRIRQYRQLVQSMSPNSGTNLLGGLIGLLMGLFFVGIHNVWVLQPVVLITLTCWFVLVFSTFWLATPERMVGWTKKVCLGSGYYTVASVMLILGLMFLIRGLYQYATHHQSFFFLP